MCKALSSDLYCTNFKCPHNLFWEELNLDRDKIQMTDRALEIGNCCCLINEPWSAEEIGDVWGLTIENIIRCERMAWGKIYKKNGWGQSDQVISSSLN